MQLNQISLLFVWSMKLIHNGGVKFYMNFYGLRGRNKFNAIDNFRSGLKGRKENTPNTDREYQAQPFWSHWERGKIPENHKAITMMASF